jgi:hypothetical protein
MDKDAEKALMELDHKLQNFGDKLSKISRENPGEGIGLLDPKSFLPHQALIDAYTIIKNWYLANLKLARDRDDDFSDRSIAFTEQLPDVGELSELEIRSVLVEVIMSNLEWAFQERVGALKLGEHAFDGLNQAGYGTSFSGEEIGRLRQSRLWSYFYRSGCHNIA